MQFSTTPTLEGQSIVEYCGVVTGEAILGANIFRDFFAGIRDIVGGRSGAYEKELRKAREIAFQELGEQAKALGADAVVGIDIDYETVGKDGSMLMVSVSAGRMACRATLRTYSHPPARRAAISYILPVGSHASLNPNRYSKPKARKGMKIDMPIIMITFTLRSKAFPCFLAACMPTGMPMTRESVTLMAINSSVQGSADMSTSVTGVFL